MIMNRTPLPCSPTQNQALEAVALVDKISSVTFRRKVNERLDFRSVGPETGNELPQVRQFHFPRPMFKFIDCGNKIHFF